MGTVIPIIFLLLVVLGGSWTAADPKSALHRERGEWCTEHQKVHKRLETIEERVQKLWSTCIRSELFTQRHFWIFLGPVAAPTAPSWIYL
ncbi:hypothetical protein GDO81_004581 [Engystomops pustulosus]|uniref:Uncharacterized protein n=1 Tax=Engystomops pustulosus TaxID=76066 RepID=A0AAV6ZYJ6_ENGPU|nr:hypothetical protein GDO81_004581 [Engystomops pustulosus]